MKNMRIGFVALTLLILIQAVGAQVEPPGRVQIAIIDSERFFDTKMGIAELISKLQPLENEFSGEMSALKDLTDKYTSHSEKLSDHLKMREIPPGSNLLPVEQQIINLRLLELEIKNKQETIKPLYYKRRNEISVESMGKIMSSLIRFAQSRGYTLVFNCPNIGKESCAVGTHDYSDITKDFIEHYQNQLKLRK